MIFKKNAISLATLTILYSFLMACSDEATPTKTAVVENKKTEQFVANLHVKKTHLYLFVNSNLSM